MWWTNRRSSHIVHGSGAKATTNYNVSMKTAISIVLALVIGGGCRYYGIPVPAPPTLFGVLLIGCITAGYVFVHRFVR